MPRSSTHAAALAVAVVAAAAAAAAAPTVYSSGRAVKFDGVDDVLSVSSGCGGGAGASPFQSDTVSMMAWFRTDEGNPLSVSSTQDFQIFGFPYQTGPRMFTSGLYPNRILKTYVPAFNEVTMNCYERNDTHITDLDGNTQTRPFYAHADHDWHHVALVHDLAHYAVYIDGELDFRCDRNMTDGPAPSFTVGSRIHVGLYDDIDHANSNAFPGFVDEVRYYLVSLDQSQVQAAMHSQPAGADLDDLAVYLNFDTADPDTDGWDVSGNSAEPTFGNDLEARAPQLVPEAAPVAGTRLLVEAVQRPAGASAVDGAADLFNATVLFRTDVDEDRTGWTVALSSVSIAAGAGRVIDAATGLEVAEAASMALTGASFIFEPAEGFTGEAMTATAVLTAGGAGAQDPVDVVVTVRANKAPVAGSGGQAIQCDGVDDFLWANGFSWPSSNQSSPDGYHFGAEPISIEWWGYIDENSALDSAIFSVGNGESTASWVENFDPYSRHGRLLSRVFTSGKMDTFVNGVYLSIDVTHLYAGWNHFAVTAGNAGVDEVKVYINGQVAAENLDTGYDSQQPAGDGGLQGLMVCSWSFWSEVYHAGIIDELRVWAGIRTEAEIQASMFTTLNGDEDGLAGYWNFDDLSPVAEPRADGDAYVAKDLSADGNDLVFGGCAPCEDSSKGWMPYNSANNVVAPEDPADADPSGIGGYRVCLPSAKSETSRYFRVSQVYGGQHCYGGKESIDPVTRPLRVASTAPIGGHVYAQLLEPGTEKTFDLNGTDPDADALQFVVTAVPERGTLEYTTDGGATYVTVSADDTVLPAGVSSVRFTPAAGGGGAPYATLGYAVQDGVLRSAVASVPLYVQCPGGQHIDASTHLCAACPVGHFMQDQSLAEACTACPANQYQASEGATECDLCLNGLQFSAAGSSACVSCADLDTVAGSASLSLDESLCTRSTDLVPSDEVVVQFHNVPDSAVRVASLPRFGELFQAVEQADGSVKAGAPIVDAFTTAGNPKRQYVSEIVSASSSREGHAAAEALGKPDAPRYGSSSVAWSPEINTEGGLETLVAAVETASFVQRVVVHESYRPGYMVAIEAQLESDGSWAPLWSADDVDSTLPARVRKFTPALCPTAEPVRTLRFSFASGRAPEPLEIDSIEVWGVATLEELDTVWVSDPEKRLVYVPGQGEGVPLSFEDTVQYQVVDCKGLSPLVASSLRLDVTVTPDLNQVSAAGAYGMVALFSLLLLVALGGVGLTFKYSKAPVVRASSLPFVLAMLAGICTEFIYGIAYAVNAAEPHEAFCFYGEFLKGAAFCALFGSLLVKSWRLRKIFGAKKLRAAKITNAQLGMALGALMAVDFAITTAMVTAGSPSLDRVTYGSEQVKECVVSNKGVWTALHIAYRASVMITVVVLAYKNRNLPGSFNESKGVAFVSYNATFFFLLESVMSPLVEGNPQAQAAVTSFSIVVIGAVALVVLVLQKFFIIVFRPDQNVTSTGTTMTAVKSGGAPASGMGSRNSKPGAGGRSGMKRPSTVNTSRTVTASHHRLHSPVASPVSPSSQTLSVKRVSVADASRAPAVEMPSMTGETSQAATAPAATPSGAGEV